MSYTETKCPDCKAVVLAPKSRPEILLDLGRRIVRAVPDMGAGVNVYQDCPNAFLVHECAGSKKKKAKESATEVAEKG